MDLATFEGALNQQNWRGPDAQHILSINEGRYLVGHNRLSIIDLDPRSDQPMISKNGRFVIAYNGEIYNHFEIRRLLGIECSNHSDTETILEGYALVGEKIFELIDGMFSLVILDKISGSWIAARDALGIKPLFLGGIGGSLCVVASEASVVASLLGKTPSMLSLDEWRIIRRPLPGNSFFENVHEVPPGTIWRHDGSIVSFWSPQSSDQPYDQQKFECLLGETITRHELSDVENVSLLSGGLDSAVITALSAVTRSYCVGMPDNNEFIDAEETAVSIGRELIKVVITPEDLQETWVKLSRLRGEPLGLPNEGLIYTVCKAMQPMEKVVLTGEGADELLFGYDGIYRWAIENPWRGVEDFLSRYGYSVSVKPTDRLISFIEELRCNKTTLEFVEDFFYQVHLPGLLRRMDFASMAASKEARVPFVSKQLINYMYRRPASIKINKNESKLPLRIMADKLNLHGALARKKIGFSAQLSVKNTRTDEYEKFQKIVMEALGW